MLAWYLGGLYLNRRRAGQLVRQVRDSIQPFGGSATIRFIGRNAFRVEATQLVRSACTEERDYWPNSPRTFDTAAWGASFLAASSVQRVKPLWFDVIGIARQQAGDPLLPACRLR